MRHYLDFAATSAVRPPEVIRAVTDFLTDCGASVGRGGHSAAVEAERIAFRCRRALMKVLRLPGDPGRIAFAFNATHAINTASPNAATMTKSDARMLPRFHFRARSCRGPFSSCRLLASFLPQSVVHDCRCAPKFGSLPGAVSLAVSVGRGKPCQWGECDPGFRVLDRELAADLP